MKSKLFTFVAALLVVVMSAAIIPGCADKGDNSSSGGNKPSSSVDTGLTLSETAITLNLGETKKLEASVKEGYTLWWDSSDSDVASIQGGLVTAKAAGKATITVSSKKKGLNKVIETKTCEVTVENKQITVDKTSVLIMTDITNTAKVEATAEGLSGDMVWKSEDESVATVKGGVITGLKTGTTNVKVSVGEVSKTVRVTVVARVFVKKGANETITSSLASAKWATANNKIATVEGGKVTGVEVGSTIVTATAGDKTEQYLVIVSEVEKEYELAAGKKADACGNPGVWNHLLESATATVSEVPTFKNGALAIDITGVGDSGTNFVYFRYQPDTTGGVIYKTTLGIYAAAEGVISINGVDTTIKAGYGTYELEYKSKKPDAQDPYQFKFRTATAFIIVPVFVETIPETPLTLDKTNVELLTTEGHNTVTLTATYEEGAVFAWESSAPEVATVENGVVTAVAPGTATITVKCNGKEASCTVIVSDKSVTLSSAFVYLYLQADEDGTTKNTKTLTATASDGSAITWSSSDNTIVTVENGKITGLKSGWATVTASIAGAKRDCTVYVVESASSFMTAKKSYKELVADGIWRQGHTYNKDGKTPDDKCTFNDGVLTATTSKVLLGESKYMLRCMPFNMKFKATYTVTTLNGGVTITDNGSAAKMELTAEQAKAGYEVTTVVDIDAMPKNKCWQISIQANESAAETVTISNIVITPMA